MNPDMKAPTPESNSGVGRGGTCNKGKIIVPQPPQNFNQSETKVINLNHLSDIMPVIERRVERALMYALIHTPGDTINLMLKTPIEPVLDAEAVAYWKRVKPIIPEMLKKGENEITEVLFKMMDYKFFWKCNDSFEDLERPIDPRSIISDLIAVRTQRKSIIYIQDHRLVEKILADRVKS